MQFCLFCLEKRSLLRDTSYFGGSKIADGIRTKLMEKRKIQCLTRSRRTLLVAGNECIVFKSKLIPGLRDGIRRNAKEVGRQMGRAETCGTIFIMTSRLRGLLRDLAHALPRVWND